MAYKGDFLTPHPPAEKPFFEGHATAEWKKNQDKSLRIREKVLTLSHDADNGKRALHPSSWKTNKRLLLFGLL